MTTCVTARLFGLALLEFNALSDIVVVYLQVTNMCMLGALSKQFRAGRHARAASGGLP